MIDRIYQNECEYLALLLNNNELIKTCNILPKYLTDNKNAKLLEYILECFRENGFVDHRKIYDKHHDFDIDYYTDIYADTFYYKNNIEEHKTTYEEVIVTNYKEYILKELGNQLNNKVLRYGDYVKKVKDLDAIKVVSPEKSMLTLNDIDLSQEELPERVKSNTATLDQAIKGFTLGQLSVWSGSNGSAKSTYLNQIAIESINQGYNVAIYSGELVAKRLLNWIIGQCAGKHNMSYNDTKDYWYVNSYAKQRIINWLNNKMFIYDNNKGNKVNDIIMSVRDCIKKNNVKVIILDNLMSMNLGDGTSKFDLQSQLVQDLSALAKELNVHIHFVCHPRKSIGFLRKTDISGTADLTNIADNVFIAHRVNKDFINKTKEAFDWKDDNGIYSFSNIVEVCKNRDFGVEDAFVGMYFEPESKRLLDYQGEKRRYKWEIEEKKF